MSSEKSSRANEPLRPVTVTGGAALSLGVVPGPKRVVRNTTPSAPAIGPPVVHERGRDGDVRVGVL